VNAAQLAPGQKAAVREIRGGHRLAERLAAMGIAPGTRLRKKSAALLRGPVVLEIGSMQVALGRGIAEKIIVETAE
jgi:ferrous iron transport protein A